MLLLVDQGRIAPCRVTVGSGIMFEAANHRMEAARCRAVAANCRHKPTSDVLREMAVEHDAKADRIEAVRAGLARTAIAADVADERAERGSLATLR